MKPIIQLRWMFAAMACVLMFSLVSSYWSVRRTLIKNREIREHELLISKLELLLSHLKDAETGQRGFLLTGKETYLAPYGLAVALIDQDVKSLPMLATVPGLGERIAAKLKELATTIEARRGRGLEEALAIVQSGQGKDLLDAIRADVSKVIGEAKQLRKLALSSAQSAGRLRNVSFIGAALLNLLFLAWIYLRITRAMRARHKASQEIAKQRELLSTTLASIGDAVILTDEKARVTFMNEVAQNLTGWRADEAKGKACSDVFHIINEHSRERVESPVDKVLATGAVVGLANHTLLIRKDGTEVPIDDSGAPVREAGGVVRGVVLVFRDFSHHKKSEREMREANEALQKASKAKDNFLAMLSHELRTPLTPVLAILSQWESQANLPAAWRGDIQMIRRNVALEARLIDDLLDLTRISRGTLSLNTEEVNLHDLIRSTVPIFDSEMLAKSLQITLQLEGDGTWTSGDPARLQQVLWNLLSNSVKFTPERGLIEIACGLVPSGQACLRVSDNGIGISETTLQYMFSPFEKENYEGVKFGGLGLGMAISRALVEAHSGTIAAASKGVGHGASFTVMLPAIIADPAKHKEPQPAEHESGASLSILLVEDHADTAQVLARLLTRSGHQVTIGGSVAAGLKLATEHSFDVLLSDLGLPDGTGLDLITQIRKFSSLPAIALSGYGMQENVNACLEAGFHAHLTKPVAIQQLRAAILQLTAGQRREREPS